MIPLRRFNEQLKRLGRNGQAGPLARFTLLFIGSFLMLQWTYQALDGTPIYRFYLETVTVRLSAALIQLIAPPDDVLAHGSHLVWRGGGLSVYNGCDGVEVMQLLIAAFVAITSPWRQRLLGAGIGLLLVYALNQARIMGLYFAARHNRVWFELLHGLVGPLIIIAVTTLFFAWWISRDESARAA